MDDSEFDRWLKYLMHLKSLNEDNCEITNELNKLTKEDARSLHSFIFRAAKMGSPLKLPKDGMEGDLATIMFGRKISCMTRYWNDVIISGAQVTLDIIGSFPIGPIATAADLSSGFISLYIGDKFQTVLSLISALPAGDALAKPVKFTLYAIKALSMGEDTRDFVGALFREEDVKKMALFSYNNLKRNKETLKQVIPSDYHKDLDDMTSYLGRWV